MMKGSEYSCCSVGHTDDNHTLHNCCNESCDDIVFDKKGSHDPEKHLANTNAADAITTSKNLSYKSVGNTNVKLSQKYFVNNYDYLPKHGTIFNIKKVVKKPSKGKTTPPTTRKRKRLANEAPMETPEAQKSPKNSENLKEKTLKVFKTTKNTEKKGSWAAKDSPEYETDCDKHPQETFQKRSKDMYASPDSYMPSVFTTKKIKEKQREDKKTVEDKKCVFACKKVSKDAEDEQMCKQGDDFKDLLFQDSQVTRRTRVPKKTNANLKQDPIKLFSLSSERV